MVMLNAYQALLAGAATAMASTVDDKMSRASRATDDTHTIKLGRPASAPRTDSLVVFAGWIGSTMHGHGRRNRPSGAPAGTYWAGDGVVPERETRQMRRSAAMGRR
jgi:hypothetical protein